MCAVAASISIARPRLFAKNILRVNRIPVAPHEQLQQRIVPCIFFSAHLRLTISELSRGYKLRVMRTLIRYGVSSEAHKCF